MPFGLRRLKAAVQPAQHVGRDQDVEGQDRREIETSQQVVAAHGCREGEPVVGAAQQDRGAEVEMTVVDADHDLVGRAREDREEGDVLISLEVMRGLHAEQLHDPVADRQQDPEPQGQIGEQQVGERADLRGRRGRQGDGKTVDQAGAGVPCRIIACGTGKSVSSTPIRISPPAMPKTPDRSAVQIIRAEREAAIRIVMARP